MESANLPPAPGVNTPQDLRPEQEQEGNPLAHSTAMAREDAQHETRGTLRHEATDLAAQLSSLQMAVAELCRRVQPAPVGQPSGVEDGGEALWRATPARVLPAGSPWPPSPPLNAPNATPYRNNINHTGPHEMPSGGRNAVSFGEPPRASLLNQSQISARQSVSKELPPFSGNPEEWPLFISSFESSTIVCGYNEAENMLRLQKALKGRALEAVRYRLLFPANLPGVMTTLRTIFGRPEVIIHTLMEKIRRMPAPKADRLETLIDFGLAIQNMCATITASGLHDYQCNAALLQELVDRLPPNTRMEWAYHRMRLASPTLADFGSWLETVVTAASLVTLPTYEYNNRAPERERTQHINAHVTEASAPHQCRVCKGTCANLSICQTFLERSTDDRWATVRGHRMCSACLVRHSGEQCVRKPCGKDGCRGYHHRLLHNEMLVGPPKVTTEHCNVHTTAIEHDNKTLLRYVPVVVQGKHRSIATYAFIDDGSTGTFVEKGLVEELGLEGTPQRLVLRWTANTTREEPDSVRLPLTILSDKGKYAIRNAHTVCSLDLPRQSVSAAELAADFEHLKGLPLKSYSDAKPRLLIGISHCHLGNPSRLVEGGPNEPSAAETKLGWVVYGPCSRDAPSGSAVERTYHIRTCETASDNREDETIEQSIAPKSLGLSVPLSIEKDEMDIELSKSRTKSLKTRNETESFWHFDDVLPSCNKTTSLRRDDCHQRKTEPASAVGMKVNQLNESSKLLQRSEDSMSSSDFALPKVVSQRKRKVRRKSRPRTASYRGDNDSDRVLSPGKQIDCKNFTTWLAMVMAILWLFVISTSVIHGEDCRLALAQRRVSAASQNVPEALQRWHGTSKNPEKNQSKISRELDNMQQILNNMCSELKRLREEIERKNGNAQEAQLNPPQSSVEDLGSDVVESKIRTNALETLFDSLQSEPKQCNKTLHELQTLIGRQGSTSKSDVIGGDEAGSVEKTRADTAVVLELNGY